eukprot:579316-Hanusia_phi.AAC.1
MLVKVIGRRQALQARLREVPYGRLKAQKLQGLCGIMAADGVSRRPPGPGPARDRTRVPLSQCQPARL